MGGGRGFGMFWSRHDTIYLISHLPKGSVLNSYDSPSLAVIFFFITIPPFLLCQWRLILLPFLKTLCSPPLRFMSTDPLVKKINTMSSF